MSQLNSSTRQAIGSLQVTARLDPVRSSQSAQAQQISNVANAAFGAIKVQTRLQEKDEKEAEIEDARDGAIQAAVDRPFLVDRAAQGEWAHDATDESIQVVSSQIADSKVGPGKSEAYRKAYRASALTSVLRTNVDGREASRAERKRDGAESLAVILSSSAGTEDDPDFNAASVSAQAESTRAIYDLSDDEIDMAYINAYNTAALSGDKAAMDALTPKVKAISPGDYIKGLNNLRASTLVEMRTLSESAKAIGLDQNPERVDFILNRIESVSDDPGIIESAVKNTYDGQIEQLVINQDTVGLKAYMNKLGEFYPKVVKSIGAMEKQKTIDGYHESMTGDEPDFDTASTILDGMINSGAVGGLEARRLQDDLDRNVQVHTEAKQKENAGTLLSEISASNLDTINGTIGRINQAAQEDPKSQTHLPPNVATRLFVDANNKRRQLGNTRNMAEQMFGLDTGDRKLPAISEADDDVFTSILSTQNIIQTDPNTGQVIAIMQPQKLGDTIVNTKRMPKQITDLLTTRIQSDNTADSVQAYELLSYLTYDKNNEHLSRDFIQKLGSREQMQANYVMDQVDGRRNIGQISQTERDRRLNRVALNKDIRDSKTLVFAQPDEDALAKLISVDPKARIFDLDWHGVMENQTDEQTARNGSVSEEPWENTLSVSETRVANELALKYFTYSGHLDNATRKKFIENRVVAEMNRRFRVVNWNISGADQEIRIDAKGKFIDANFQNNARAELKAMEGIDSEGNAFKVYTPDQIDRIIDETLPQFNENLGGFVLMPQDGYIDDPTTPYGPVIGAGGKAIVFTGVSTIGMTKTEKEEVGKFYKDRITK